MKLRRFFKAVIFVLLLVVTLTGLETLFLVGPFSNEERVGRDNHASFRAQKDNTLDVVYVGASNVYSFWQAPLAWDRCGLASQSYSNWSMPPAAIRYIIQECRKTQPNALYVVNINNFRAEGNSKVQHCHWSTDDMPLSADKLELVQALCEQNGYGLDEAIELLFPLLGFHSTWSDLQSEDFVPQYANVGGAATNPNHFTTKNVRRDFEKCASLRASLQDYGPFDDSNFRRDSIDDLIAYCKRENVSILFVLQPQAITDPEVLHHVDLLCDVIRDAGMDMVDLRDPATTGLNPNTDFWNPRHTNAHGSIKYTYYLAEYITAKYDIPDRRNDPDYASWNEVAERYKTFLMTHTVREYEFDMPSYRNDLRVSNLQAQNMHFYVNLTWEPAYEVSEYYVYRQCAQKIYNPASVDNLEEYAWQHIATLPPDATSYMDKEIYESMPLVSAGASLTNQKDVLEKQQYDYVVVPVIHGVDGDTYGSYYTMRGSVELLRAAEGEN